MPDLYFPVHADQSARLGSASGIPVREDTAYTNAKGKEKRGIRKRAEKVIEKLQEALHKVLEPEEAVIYTAGARLPVNKLEEFFLGWLAYYTENGILVLTNRRLLFFLVTRNGSWKKSVRSVRWGDVERAQVKGWLGKTLVVRYRNGIQEAYWRLRGEDAKKIKASLATLSERGQGESTPTQGMTHLCPECVAPLTYAAYKCAKCNLDFKNEKTMARRAWLFPGAGYLYAGHPGLAALDIMIEGFILLEIFVISLQALGLIEQNLRPGEQPLSPGGLWFVAGLIALIWVVKKFLTIRHCQRFIREFIPAK